MVTSPSKTLLSHVTPVTVVTRTGEAIGVNPGSGLALKEIVGRAPDVVGAAEPEGNVGNGTVGSGAEVFVGDEVGEGSAAAVCVKLIENWATVVPTIDVCCALISIVGSAVWPILQPARTSPMTSKAGNTCFVVFPTFIFVPPGDAAGWLNFEMKDANFPAVL